MEQTEKTKRPHSRLLWLVLAAVLVFAATAAMAYQSAQNYTGAGNNISEHVMAKTESKEATYWEEGNLVYWQCSNEACKDKYYKDENGDGQYENKAATVIPKLKYFETGTVKVTPTNEANRATENKEGDVVKSYRVPDGGTVVNKDTDAKIADIKGAFIVNVDGTIVVPKDSTATTPDGKTVTGPIQIGIDGAIKYVVPGADNAYNTDDDVKVKPTTGGTVTRNNDNSLTVTGGGTVTKADESKIADVTGDFTLKADGTIVLPKDSTATTPDGKTITGPAEVTATGEITVSVQGPDKKYETKDDVKVTPKADGAATRNADNSLTVTGGGTVTKADGTTAIATVEGGFTVNADGKIEIPNGTTAVIKDKNATVTVITDEDGTKGKTERNEAGELVVTGPATIVVDLKTDDESFVRVEKTHPQFTDQQRIEALAAYRLQARSANATSPNGKKAILVKWKDINRKELNFDGVEIYRSTKRYSGFGKKPIYIAENGKSNYYNTLIKGGTKYYYKVRGYIQIGEKKYYTKWSTKAVRTAKKAKTTTR